MKILFALVLGALFAAMAIVIAAATVTSIKVSPSTTPTHHVMVDSTGRFLVAPISETLPTKEGITVTTLFQFTKPVPEVTTATKSTTQEEQSEQLAKMPIQTQQ